MKKVTVLFSGGLDSTVALALAKRDYDLEYALFIDYGQRHIKEIESAKYVAKAYSARLMVLDMSGWGRAICGSALTDPRIEVPDEKYDWESMALTVVPNRNGTMLMAAAGIAASLSIDEVWAAVHGGDHYLYADCRPDFFDAVSQAVYLGTEGRVAVRAPFLRMTKTDIVRIGVELNVPFEHTWSCYVGGDRQCGRCGTCRERVQAFTDAGVFDPTNYMERKDVDACGDM